MKKSSSAQLLPSVVRIESSRKHNFSGRLIQVVLTPTSWLTLALIAAAVFNYFNYFTVRHDATMTQVITGSQVPAQSCSNLKNLQKGEAGCNRVLVFSQMLADRSCDDDCRPFSLKLEEPKLPILNSGYPQFVRVTLQPATRHPRFDRDVQLGLGNTVVH
eukprot:5647815-Pyramimonas_sp.AAC.1